ncbi:hypothetical protein R6Q59_010961 [Mikania micrantha]
MLENTMKLKNSTLEWPGVTTRDSASNKKKTVVIAVVSTSICLVLACLSLAVYARIKKRKSYMKRQVSSYDGRKEDIDLPFFSLPTIAKSTSNFSVTNKLGQGGFGPVYKMHEY